MDVIHERCAGLDVHKDDVVAWARVLSGRKVLRASARFPTTTRRSRSGSAGPWAFGCGPCPMELTFLAGPERVAAEKWWIIIKLWRSGLVGLVGR